MMRRVTMLRYKIHKINKKCSEAQRTEIDRRIVQNMQEKCERKANGQTLMDSADQKLKKLYN